MLQTTWRFLGRLLITLILFSMAYEKLQHPDMYKLDYTKSIDHVNTLAGKMGFSLPDLKSHVTLIIKLSGLLDAFIAMLIIVNDKRGGMLLFVTKLLTYASLYLPWSSNCLKSYSQRERFANSIGILGVSLILMRNH